MEISRAIIVTPRATRIQAPSLDSAYINRIATSLARYCFLARTEEPV